MTVALQGVLDDFLKDLERHEVFIKLEAKIKNPASSVSRPRSETLLSAYVSLSCGRFERFLQQSFYHAADDLRQRIVMANDQRIIKVDTFEWQNVNGFLKWAASAKGVSHADILLKVRSFSLAMNNGHIFPESFQHTNANPNSDTLTGMFGNFGIEHPFNKLAMSYLDALGRSFTAPLIKTTLDAFVKRRHQAAHYGRISGMTRVDAQSDHIFIVGLSKAIINVLIAHTAQIV